MHAISARKSSQISAETIQALEQEVGRKVELMDKSTVEASQGWVFFFDSAAFLLGTVFESTPMDSSREYWTDHGRSH